MPAIQPTASRIFTAPELWVILKALGAVAADTPIPPEITSDPVAVPLAQTDLLLAGVVDAGPYGKDPLQVSAEVEALVRPTVSPETVFMVSVTPNAKTNLPAKLVCFNWTPATLVVNWVDESNTHHFVAYAPEAAPEVVREQIQEMCDLDIADLTPARDSLTPKEVVNEMEQMKEAVLVMAIEGVQESEQSPHALGWFVSGRQGWLMQQGEPDDKPAPSMVSRAELVAALSEFVETVLAPVPETA